MSQSDKLLVEKTKRLGAPEERHIGFAPPELRSLRCVMFLPIFCSFGAVHSSNTIMWTEENLTELLEKAMEECIDVLKS